MIALLALSLGVDAFAVSVSCGMSIPHFKKTRLLWLAGYFGLFQAGMTLLGAFLGGYFSDFAGAFGGVIAFLLLAAIGGEMIWSSLRAREQTDDIRTLTHGRMLVLALATSVDAAAAGVSLGLQQANVPVAGAVIGLTALGLALLGGLFGERLGASLHRRAEFIGGLVLIALGVQSLLR